FKVTGGAVTLTLPYPPLTSDTIGPARDTSPTYAVNAAAGTTQHDWDVVTQITPTISTLITYRLTSSAIQIVKEVTTNGTSTTTFSPSPAVDFIQLNNGEGHTWHTAGVDTASNAALEIEGNITKRE